MQIVLQIVRILIPHSVEILQCEPLRLENLLGTRESKAVEQAGFELIIRHSILLSAADIICSVPELIWNPILTDLSQKTSGILYSGPLENSAHRHMESGGIQHFKNAGI